MFPLPLQLTLVPGRMLRLSLFALHLAALAALWLARLPPIVQGLASMGVGLSLYRHLRPQAVIRLRGHADGRLEIRQNEAWKPLEATPAMLLPWLTVLRYRQSGTQHWHTLVVMPDSLPEDDFRRLRVWLRWGMNSSDGDKHDVDQNT